MAAYPGQQIRVAGLRICSLVAAPAESERRGSNPDVASLGHLGNLADAEDAVQNALLPALTHVDQFKGRAQMSIWLTTIRQ